MRTEVLSTTVWMAFNMATGVALAGSLL